VEGSRLGWDFDLMVVANIEVFLGSARMARPSRRTLFRPDRVGVGPRRERISRPKEPPLLLPSTNEASATASMSKLSLRVGLVEESPRLRTLVDSPMFILYGKNFTVRLSTSKRRENLGCGRDLVVKWGMLVKIVNTGIELWTVSKCQSNYMVTTIFNNLFHQLESIESDRHSTVKSRTTVSFTSVNYS
jgi:hypothetical protein